MIACHHRPALLAALAIGLTGCGDSSCSSALRIGMTPGEVIAVCGSPRSISVSVYSKDRSEQWAYHGLPFPKLYVYIDNGKLSAWQASP